MEKFLKNGTIVDLCSNKVMLCAVLEYFYGLTCPTKINGEEFEDNSVEFASQLANRPELTMLVLEENKRSILYGIADNPEKPSCFSPYDYYNGLVVLIDVLHKLTGNFTEAQISAAYDKYKYNPICDAILYYSVYSYMDDEFWDGEVERISIATFEEFCNGLKEHVSYYFKEEVVDSIIESLISYWKEEQKEKPDIFEEDENEMESYGWQLKSVFSPEHLLCDIEEFLDIL